MHREGEWHTFALYLDHGDAHVGGGAAAPAGTRQREAMRVGWVGCYNLEETERRGLPTRSDVRTTQHDRFGPRIAILYSVRQQPLLRASI